MIREGASKGTWSTKFAKAGLGPSFECFCI